MSLNEQPEYKYNTANEEKKYFIKKWYKELTKKLGKTKKNLLDFGLLSDDFGKNDVFIEYEDGSSSFYRSSFFIQNKQETAIFTEHNGYYELKHEYINHIEEQQFHDEKFTIKLNRAGNVQIKILKNGKKITLKQKNLSEFQHQINLFSYFNRGTN